MAAYELGLVVKILLRVCPVSFPRRHIIWQRKVVGLSPSPKACSNSIKIFRQHKIFVDLNLIIESRHSRPVNLKTAKWSKTLSPL